MKILFSVTYYHPYVSGLTLAASRWAEGLVSNNNQVTVLCMFGSGKRVIPAKSLFKISKGFFSIDWFIKSWQLVQKNDVVVVNLPQFEGIIPAVFAKLMGKKLIAIYHCEVVLPEGFINSVIQSLLEVSNAGTLLLSDHVVTYTEDYAKHSRLLRSLRLPKKIAYIVPPIPKLNVNKALVMKLKKNIGSSDFIVGVAARLSAEKGIEYLLEALPQLPNVKVVVAGSMEPVGEEVYKKKIMKLVKKFKKRVVFLGQIQPEDMGSFYNLLDVLVLPSINSTEAFGMVQVEAMKQGVPVVASDLPGVRVPVQKTGMGRVVKPKDARSLAQAIISVIHDKKMYAQMAARVDRYFNEEKALRLFEATIS